MKKKKDKNNNEREIIGKKKFNYKLLLILIFNTIIIFSIYRLGVMMEYEPILWIYFAAALLFSLAYIIYNRGLSRRNITPDMLPDTWSPIQKQKFFDEDKKWKEKSKWMLTILFPLIITFMYELLDLFFFENLKFIFPALF
ncbi:MAG: hypothetical protein GX303_04160 [Clostridiales bacterium]|nr:hypothetical protein [Clostridiales bacterium]